MSCGSALRTGRRRPLCTSSTNRCPTWYREAISLAESRPRASSPWMDRVRASAARWGALDKRRPQLGVARHVHALVVPRKSPLVLGPAIFAPRRPGRGVGRLDGQAATPVRAKRRPLPSSLRAPRWQPAARAWPLPLRHRIPRGSAGVGRPFRSLPSRLPSIGGSFRPRAYLRPGRPIPTWFNGRGGGLPLAGDASRSRRSTN